MARWIPLAVFLAGSVSACDSDSSMMAPDVVTGDAMSAASAAGAVAGSCDVRLGSLSPENGWSDDPLLFQVWWGGASSTPQEQRLSSDPLEAEFFARIQCPSGNSSWANISLDPEVATWGLKSCDMALLQSLQVYDSDALMLCGVVTPVNHGRVDLVVTERGSASASLPVIANRTPTYARDVPRIRVEMGVGESVTVDVGPHFTDPDGDPLELRIGRWQFSTPQFLDLEMAGTIVRMTAFDEGHMNGAIPITASDGFHEIDMIVGLVQAGCPGLADLPRVDGTGRIQIAYKTDPDYSECFNDVVWAAVAYWEDVLAGDSRYVEITFDPNAEVSGWSSASGGGTGPVSNPSGEMNIQSTYPLWAGPTRFYGTVRHELAHALGFGVAGSWYDLLKNPYPCGNSRGTCPIQDTHFQGEQAYQAFLDLGGGEYYGTRGVPVEDGTPGRGGNPNGHWRVSIIDREFMAGCKHVAADPCPSPEPVSAITLGALADMGWVVDMSMAESGTRVGNFGH